MLARLVAELYCIVAFGERVRQANRVTWRQLFKASSTSSWSSFAAAVRVMCAERLLRVKLKGYIVFFTASTFLRVVSPLRRFAIEEKWMMREQTRQK